MTVLHVQRLSPTVLSAIVLLASNVSQVSSSIQAIFAKLVQ